MVDNAWKKLEDTSAPVERDGDATTAAVKVMRKDENVNYG